MPPQKLVKKVIVSSETRYGFIHLPKEARIEPFPQRITLLIDEEKASFRTDKYYRIWVGKSFMKKHGLLEKATISLEWLRPGELKLSLLEITTVTEVMESKLLPDHNAIRDTIHDIGVIKGVVSEIEYPIEGMRIDVVWKKVKRGNPYVVFEVQVGGNFFEALTKLKHAYDMWNSIPYLVTTQKYEEKAAHLLEGSFHEIQKVTRIINWREIERLHNLLKKIQKLETKIKLPRIR